VDVRPFQTPPARHRRPAGSGNWHRSIPGVSVPARSAPACNGHIPDRSRWDDRAHNIHTRASPAGYEALRSALLPPWVVLPSLPAQRRMVRHDLADTEFLGKGNRRQAILQSDDDTVTKGRVMDQIALRQLITALSPLRLWSGALPRH